MQMLGGRGGGGGGGQNLDQTPDSSQARPGNNRQNATPPAEDFVDDDIPF